MPEEPPGSHNAETSLRKTEGEDPLPGGDSPGLQPATAGYRHNDANHGDVEALPRCRERYGPADCQTSPSPESRLSSDQGHLKVIVRFREVGGCTRARTLDPLIKSQLLYQLSYTPVRKRRCRLGETAYRGRRDRDQAPCCRAAMAVDMLLCLPRHHTAPTRHCWAMPLVLRARRDHPHAKGRTPSDPARKTEDPARPEGAPAHDAPPANRTSRLP